MDPEYESLEEAEDDKNQDLQIRSKKDLSLRKRRELIPRGRAGNNWSGLHRSPNFNHESSRKMQGEDTSERPNESLLNQSKEMYQSVPSFTDIQTPSPGNLAPKLGAQQPNSVAAEMNSANPNELEKIWHYADPSNNIQGPFSLTQLRKWSTTGYFPPDMRIWRTSEKQEDSCLLADVLSGRFYIQHSGFPHQQNRGFWNAHQTINQPTLDGFSSQSPAWCTPGVEILNSGVWPGNSKPEGPIYNNPYQNPTYEETSKSGGNGGRWNQEQDYGNMWSPTRLRAIDTLKIEDNLTSDPSIVVGTSIANERNSGINKYRTFESDCPSPTPRTEKTEISQGFAAPFGTSDPSLATHPTIFNFESANTDSAEGLGSEFPHNGVQKLDSWKSASSEFPNNFSTVAGTSEDMGIQKVDTGLPSMDHTSLQKQFPIVSSLAPPSILDQAQNINQNFSPIHQLNPQSAVQVDSSLPSPTPKSSNNTWGIDPPVPSQAVQNANVSLGGPPQGNPGWGSLANMGWGTPGQMDSNVNTGRGMPIQMNANVNMNTGWGAPLQVNSNANTGWGTPVQMSANANKGWGTPSQVNMSSNTGWGVPAQVNMNANTGWGTPAQVNTNANTGWVTPAQVNTNTNTGWGTPAQVNTNPNAGWGMPIQGSSNDWGTMEAIPSHDNDANARAGWGSSFGSKSGGWKSSDADTSRRFSHHDGANSDGYSRHRYTGHHGGTDSRNNSSQLGVRGGGPSRAHQVPPGGDGQRGVCRFYENGHCKKGRYCTYLHTDTKRNIR